MSFPKAFLEELKARIRVSDVVGRKVKLTRRGREWVGLSPFTNEKTPSFTVNDDKQFYHCFSSGEHGDAIKFLEKVENLTFLEAVERLAGEAGMEMPQRDPQEAVRAKERAGLADIMAMAVDYFRASFGAGAGAEARAYLERRGLSQATIEAFKLGFAPDSRSGLKNYLTGRGVSVADMIEAGLLIGGDDIPEPYDRFRNRVMFPIEDQRGRVIAFGGRALDPNAKAKYLNSPETPLFHKGHILYNARRAREAAHKTGRLVAVEGYMDVIALAQAGFDACVAPLGTALTETQIALMWRMVPEPILCFDGDRAGLGAAYRAVERVLPLLKPGHSLRFALLAQGQDPDDLVRAEGPEAFEQVLGQAVALFDMVWEKALQEGPWDTPEQRALFEARIEGLVNQIGDQKVRSYYARALKDRISAHFNPQSKGTRGGEAWRQDRGGGWQKPFDRMGRGRKPVGASPQLRRSALARGGDGVREREALLVATMLNCPELLDNHCEAFALVDLKGSELDKLRNEIIDIAALHGPLDRMGLKNHLELRELGPSVGRLLAQTVGKSDSVQRDDIGLAAVERGWLQLLARHRTAVLQSELKAAEQALGQETTDENWARLQALHEQMGREETDLKDFGDGSEDDAVRSAKM